MELYNLIHVCLQSHFKPLYNRLSYSDEDECSPENVDRFCPSPGICTNSDGGFTCDCPAGYEHRAAGCKGKFASSALVVPFPEVLNYRYFELFFLVLENIPPLLSNA